MTQLAQTGGGRMEPPASGVFTADRPVVFAAVDMIPVLMLFTLPFLLFDIATRRLAVERSDFARALAWVTGRKATVPKGRAATPELSRLMERKEAAVGNRKGEKEKRRKGEKEMDGEDSSFILHPSSLAEHQTPNTERRSRTIRPEGAETVAAAVVPVEDVKNAPVVEEEAGMSRLMAAKKRAQQRQQEKDDAG